MQEGEDYYIDADGKAKYYLSALTENEKLHSLFSAADRFEYLGGRDKLNQLKEYAGEAAGKEGTVSHAVISAMEEIGTDEELQQAIETSKKQGLGAQIWSALDNAWDSFVKGVSGADEAFENAGESLVKGVSGIDEAFVSGGETLAKSRDDLTKALTSEETREALWFALYSVLAVHTGGLTTMISSDDEELDEAWEKINAARLVSPSSWTNTIPLFSAVDKWEYFKSLSKENQIEFLIEVLENTDAIENIIETFVQEMTNKE